MDNKKLQELEKSLAFLQENIKDSKEKVLKSEAGDHYNKDEIHRMVGNIYDSMYNMADNLRRSVYAMQDVHSEHLKGHWPPLTASQLNAGLKNCGADGDFVCEPKKIVARASRASLEVEFKK